MTNAERKFLQTLQDYTREDPKSMVLHPRQIHVNMGLEEGFTVVMLQRWTERGWYVHTVNLYRGWLTKKGMDLNPDTVEVSKYNEVIPNA